MRSITKEKSWGMMSRQDLSILIGTAVDYYDSSIYYFLAPIIANLFFPHSDPIVRLMMAYCVLFTSIISKPLGSLIFGSLASIIGPDKSLSICLAGVTILTTTIGFLPTYHEVGIFAPLLLVAARIFKEVFSAGEGTIASLYILDNKKEKDLILASSYYQVSIVAGLILASFISTIISFNADHPHYWRIPFILGSVTGFISLYFRNKNYNFKPREKVFISYLWKKKTDIIRLTVLYGFCNTTYFITFVFMNTFMPLISSHTGLGDMLARSTLLLIIDAALIIAFGRLLSYENIPQKMMKAAIALSLVIVPLFNYLPNCSPYYIFFVRLTIVTIGVFYLSLFSVFIARYKNQYLLNGFSRYLSNTLFGRGAPVICLLIWQKTKLAYAPGIYIALVGLLTVLALKSLDLADQKKLQ